MINSHLLRFATFSMIVFSAPLAWAESMGQPTQNGAPSAYLDIDVEGRIIEVNLLAQTAQKVGDISGIPSDSVFYQSGFSFGDREFALLFFRNVGPPDRYVQTPFIFSRSNGTFRLTPLAINVAGDGGIVPLNPRSVFTSTVDLETGVSERTIYDAVANTARGTFDFRISPYTINSEIMENRYAYFAERTGPHVLKVNVSSGEVEQEYNMIDLVGTDNPGVGVNVMIRALHGDFVLVARWFPDAKNSRLFLVDLKNESIAAKSEFLTDIGIRFLLFEDNNGNIIAKCIRETQEESGSPATGVVFTFSITGNSINAQGTESFDPDSQIVVTDETGAPVIMPRYRFDYLSMREVQREIFRRLGTAALGSIEARRRVRDEIIAEFNNPEQEGFTSRTLTHLEIR